MSPLMDTLYMFVEVFAYIIAALCVVAGILVYNTNILYCGISLALALFCGYSAFKLGRKRKAILQQAILEKKKKKQALIEQIDAETAMEVHPHAQLIQFINEDVVERCKNKFIAIDTETTGLSLDDRIIEMSAVIFEGFVPTKRFTTLVNPGIKIPTEASKINGITNDMVKDALTEQKAILDFIRFIGPDAMCGDTILVAHKAKFDIDFIRLAFARVGMPADLTYMDTLSISKGCVRGVENYKLHTLAEHFNIQQLHAHRAEDDAEACGQIFVKLLEMN